MVPPFVVSPGARVKRIGCAAVPSAKMRPPAATVMPMPLFKYTLVPGAIVSVTPLFTVSAAVIW